jgi:hypothetical protein
MTFARSATAVVLTTLAAIALTGCGAIGSVLQGVQDQAVVAAGGCPSSAVEGFKDGYLNSTAGTDAAEAEINEITSDEFLAQQIGDDKLGTGCYIRTEFTTAGSTIMLDTAMLPQSGTAMDDIAASLTAAGFEDAGSANTYVSADGTMTVSLTNEFDQSLLDELGGAYAPGVVVVTAYTLG